MKQCDKESQKIVDVDGSYLYRKYKFLTETGVNVARPVCPSPPITGWVFVTEENYQVISPSLLAVTPGRPKNVVNEPRLLLSICADVGLLYTYLAGHVGRVGDQGAFRALTRGYTHWASELLQELEVNTNHPEFCHVRVTMKPRMKEGTYHIYLLFGREGELATICCATCQCAAGYVHCMTSLMYMYIHAQCIVTFSHFLFIHIPHLQKIS